MNAHLRLRVHRYDGSWRVSASDSELEHMHRHPFPFHEAAQRFKARVRQALEEGRDLDLRHWEYTGP